jgi:hypothetical protein
LPHRITTSSALSPTFCTKFPPTTTQLQNWLNDFFMAKLMNFFKREIKNLPKRWEAVMNNGGKYIID